MTAPLDPGTEDAYQALVTMLREWGLESLAPRVLEMLQGGHSQDSIPFMLQDTDEYKQRFAGNEARRQAGMRVLNPREYLELEGAYRQILSSAGMPVGFYDDPSDFAGWIGGDVSASEVKSRVDLATDAVSALDDGTRRAFREFHGLYENDLAAFYLDRDRALPLLQKQSRAVQVGGAAFSQGLEMSRERAEELAISPQADNARLLYGQVAEATREGRRLGDIYGDEYGQKDAEDEVFFGLESAKRARKNLAQREEASFSGKGGVGRTSLSRRRSGAY